MPKDRCRARLVAALAALFAVAILHLLINLQLTVYSDDYWYGTFLNDGLVGFLKKTYRHYMEQNGRLIIHVFIPFVLLFDTKLFAVLSPILTSAIFLVGLRVLDERTSVAGLIFGAAMCLLNVLGSEIQYLRMSLYWLSAYFNYAAPLLPALGALLFAVYEAKKTLGKWAYAAALVTSILAGASTEQTGICALIFLWGYYLLLPKERRTPRLLFLALAVSAGYLTVLLAPGSRARVERGIDGGILSFLDPRVFKFRFFDVMGYLTGFGFWNALFAALCALAGLSYIADRELPKLLLTGFPACACVIILWALGLKNALSAATVLYTLFLTTVMLTSRTLRLTGLILLGAGASVMMLIVTTLYYARTFFPCVLLTVLVCWSLALRAARGMPPALSAAVCVALAAVFVARFIPMYNGYRENKSTVDANISALEAAKTTGEAELSIDLDGDHRYTMFFEGSYFLDNYLAYYGLPRDTHVTYTSARWDVSRAVADGKELPFPVLGMDGVTLFPVESLINTAGGSSYFEWRDHSFENTFRGVEYLQTEDGRLYRLEDGERKLIDSDCRYVMPFSYTYTILYMSREDLERCYGMEFSYDPSADTYTLLE